MIKTNKKNKKIKIFFKCNLTALRTYSKNNQCRRH